MNYYHLAELVHRQADKYEDRVALKQRNHETGIWTDISWREYSDKVMQAAKAMAEFGIKEEDKIGIYSQNMPKYLYTDFAAYANRAVTVPMYATNSPAQIEYIINDAAIHTIFVGEQLQYNNAFSVQKNSETLKRLIVFDKSVTFNPDDKTSIYFEDFLCLGESAHAESTVKIRMHEASLDDMATIIYTSGTTGEAKGVVLHHYNFNEVFRIHDIRLPIVNDQDISMCFLPLTHVFEKAWTYYCTHKGVTNAINQDPKKIQETLKEVRPTLMCNVPRFWEKVYVGVQDKINSAPGFMKAVFKDAIETGRVYNLEYKRKGITPPNGLSLKFKLYDATVFKLLKKALGIEKGRLFPTAGAPLAANIDTFLESVNIPIVVGYGLTETSATVCFYPAENFVIGSIGTVMPNLQVKIDPENDEILIKGRTITPGYYNKPEENAKAFTEDGFFRTGDAGWFEGDTLFFKERIKDLYKTSNGKYVAPQAIEGLISSDKYIQQIAVIGDQRKFVGALIVPDFQLLEQYAKQKGISYSSHEELVKNPDIIHMIEARMEEHQKDLASYEKIKRFVLLPKPFTMESREMTNTLKLRRPVILQNYAGQIEEMYEEKDIPTGEIMKTLLS
ncbi:MAG: long-chain fatty acid--CoA ligase [Tannerellaceae bacterium]|nr:long-chain fatty acid--CoA ligase [Tannerellaceae bacterium]